MQPPKPKPQSTHSTRTIILAVLSITFTRLVINMSRRFPYPFLPAISRQLTVPLSSVQSVMAAQAGIGLAAPLFGPLAEHYGRKYLLIGSLLMMLAGSALGALFPQFWVFGLVMMALGLGKVIFDPTAQAYLGDRIPYRQRGLALGVTELAWSLSLIIAAPLAGFLLSAPRDVLAAETLLELVGYPLMPGLLRGSSGIQSMFAVLTVLIGLSLLAVWFYLPGDRPQGGTQLKHVTPAMIWRTLRESPAAMGAVVYGLCVAIANEMFLINYGIWMETSFDLVLAALGLVTVVIAAAEITGEFIVIFLADTLGKRRLALVGIGGSSLCYVILPNLAFSLPVALTVLFILFVFVEVSIVASIPLLTEVMPHARAVMMSSSAAAHALGRAGGGILGGLFYALTGSFLFIGIVSTVVGLTALYMMLRYVQEGEDT